MKYKKRLEGEQNSREGERGKVSENIASLSNYITIYHSQDSKQEQTVVRNQALQHFGKDTPV